MKQKQKQTEKEILAFFESLEGTKPQKIAKTMKQFIGLSCRHLMRILPKQPRGRPKCYDDAALARQYNKTPKTLSAAKRRAFVAEWNGCDEKTVRLALKTTTTTKTKKGNKTP